MWGMGWLEDPPQERSERPSRMEGFSEQGHLGLFFLFLLKLYCNYGSVMKTSSQSEVALEFPREIDVIMDKKGKRGKEEII